MVACHSDPEVAGVSCTAAIKRSLKFSVSKPLSVAVQLMETMVERGSCRLRHRCTVARWSDL